MHPPPSVNPPPPHKVPDGELSPREEGQVIFEVSGNEGSNLFEGLISARMLCTFGPTTILGDFYRIPERSPKSSGGPNVQSM